MEVNGSYVNQNYPTGMVVDGLFSSILTCGWVMVCSLPRCHHSFAAGLTAGKCDGFSQQERGKNDELA